MAYRESELLKGFTILLPPPRDVSEYLKHVVGLLQGDAQVAMLHSTFHEFLTAEDLAHRANEVGYADSANWTVEKWKEVYARIDAAYSNGGAKDELTDGRVKGEPGQGLAPIERFVAFLDHKSWTAEWFEVIRFLTGCMTDATPLLIQLGETYSRKDQPPLRDDSFRHRLALAATCLPEARDEVVGMSVRPLGGVALTVERRI
jgi:hypothetical protein